MRIVAFDLETTDLKANFGTILCASFLEIVPPGYYLHGAGRPKPYTFVVNTSDHLEPNPDESIAVRIRENLEAYNCIVSWNGKMFDAPFLNARLLYHHARPVRPQFHLDLMYYAGYSFNRIGSKRLASVQQFLGLEDEKTPLLWDVWKRAARGDEEAMAEVVHHCEVDVKVLAEAYWRLIPYVRNLHRAG